MILLILSSKNLALTEMKKYTLLGEIYGNLLPLEYFSRQSYFSRVRFQSLNKYLKLITIFILGEFSKFVFIKSIATFLSLTFIFAKKRKTKHNSNFARRC